MKKNLKMSEKEAKELYPNASEEFQKVLESTFGKKMFEPETIMDKIQDWDDVLEYAEDELGIEFKLPYCKAKTKEEKSINAFAKIQLISKVLNEGWEPDFNNTNQYKYYPWFKKSRSGWSVHSYPYCGYSADCGFGCYFKSSELALYSGNTFLDIYIDYLPE